MTAAGRAAPTRCPACDIVPKRSYRLSNGARLLRCPRCGMGWWNWTPFEPRGFYDRDYFQSPEVAKGYDDYRALEATSSVTARARLSRVAALRCGRRGRLLDVGCGTGGFLEEARRVGWEASGVEVSEYAAESARERGFSVRCTAIEDLSPRAGEFDCVTLWDVIEHLRDPAGVLRKLGRALRSGGVLALSTGDLTSWCARISGRRWHLFNLPEHLFFFSPSALRKLCAASNLRTRRITREVNWAPVSYLFERLRKSLFGRGGKSAGASSLAARLCVPATLFDVLGVYATRE